MGAGGAEAHSWVEVGDESDFPIANLPYGVFSRDGGAPRIGVAIGERILDLQATARTGLLDGAVARELVQASSLDGLAAAGSAVWRALRARLIELLRADACELRERNADALLVPMRAARMHVPTSIGDYVDFYSSLEHATNLGKLFRPDSEPLLPNWRYLPVGYHGRSSTVVPGGTPIVRPCGQSKPPGELEPRVGPTQSLDIEVELGFVSGPGNALGERIAAGRAREHIFGMVLVNDWSARDIQAWEYQPLGPFLGKSFATSISPWIVTLDALEPFRVPGPPQEPAPPEYLRVAGPWNFDIALEVGLQSARMRESGIAPLTVVRTNAKYLYWNAAQQLAHVTVNGTATRPGDLYASGTISGPHEESFGSFIERTWRGARPLALPTGETRAFLADGDSVRIHGRCERSGYRSIGFGTLEGTILPARWP